MSLEDKVIKLGSQNRRVRPYLIPMLKRAGLWDKVKSVWDKATGKELSNIADAIKSGKIDGGKYKQKKGESSTAYAVRLNKAYEDGKLDDIAKQVKKLDKPKGKKKPDLKKQYETYRKSLKDPNKAQPFKEWAQKQKS